MSNRYTLEVRMDGAAFDNQGAQMAELLRKAADSIDMDETIVGRKGKLLDFNGNTVGTWEAEEIGC